MKRLTLTTLLTICFIFCFADQRKINFCRDWQLHYPASAHKYAGTTKMVTLPRAWNEDFAYKVGIAQLPDDTCRYVKTFTPPMQWKGKKVFIEFEGVRQCAEVWLNGHRLGMHENGIMAFGFDLTPYIIPGKENRIDVLTDNDWAYKEKATGSSYQWNNKNFNMNMGGIVKNVWLHVKDEVYQTLPLFSNLGTTGVYVYGTDYDVKGKRMTCNVESQVVNASAKARRIALMVSVMDIDGKKVAEFHGKEMMVGAGDTVSLRARKAMRNVHFWSWGYGYLYKVVTRLAIDGKAQSDDEVVTTTGFRKTKFGEGKIWLNDRVMMMHGYAQRTSNEWPAVGIDIPAWLSDYSNDLIVKSGGNLVRWMHVTPSKQDVESCDRVGLIQAMPAGDAEKDVVGRHWTQRTELMRDAIIYNRNNPSILFYEGGNESISREHMKELISIRDQYDPHGGRAIGSREMLDIDEAEYGGEMLYINKSGKHPMWAMEYCRDEGYRMYWDDWSYPYHRHGAGPFYRNASAEAYNQNADMLALEQVRRWNDYFIVRPGMGKRVSSGGVKIIFSDTNTHGRSEFNYRVSGVVDAMRIPKDAFYTHQVMWNSWCDIQHKASHILGHWNYQGGVAKDIHVISTSPVVELFVNGKSVGKSDKAEASFIHTFKDVKFIPGEIKAVSYAADGVTKESEASHKTAGEPHHLKLTLIDNPDGGMKADGADLAIVQVEVKDKDGMRCPLDNRLIHWSLEGQGEWRGGIAKSPDLDNYILSETLPVEAGISRVIVRSTTVPGLIRLTAKAQGLEDAILEWTSTDKPCTTQKMFLERGETPLTPSYTEKKRTITILSAEAGANQESAKCSWDDNELSEWKNDGKLSTAWIAYNLGESVAVDEISIKLTGWRKRSYPIEVYAVTDDGKAQMVWKGNTEKSLGYVSLCLKNPVKARKYIIKQVGTATEKDAFGQVTELAGGPATELDLYKTPGSEKVKGELRIVEIDFLKWK